MENKEKSKKNYPAILAAMAAAGGGSMYGLRNVLNTGKITSPRLIKYLGKYRGLAEFGAPLTPLLLTLGAGGVADQLTKKGSKVTQVFEKFAGLHLKNLKAVIESGKLGSEAITNIGHKLTEQAVIAGLNNAPKKIQAVRNARASVWGDLMYPPSLYHGKKLPHTKEYYLNFFK